MKHYLALFLCFCTFQLTAIDRETVDSLLQEVYLQKELLHELQETADFTETMISQDSQTQIFTQMARMLMLLRDLPVLNKGEYPKKQTALLQAAAKALKQEESVGFHEYQTSDNHQNIHFIFDIENDQKQIAVFKSDGERAEELLTWELAAIFGIEEAVTPALSLTLYGQTGELQIFQNNELTTQPSYDPSLYGLVTFNSYWKCALVTLLFALHDMDNENCFFQFCREGYLKMGMLDTLMAFDRTEFLPYQFESHYPSLDSPFSWIGWDFPQRNRPITKRFKEPIINLIGTWPSRIEAMKQYLAHPMTKYTLTDSQTNQLIQRALTLRQVILKDPSQPIRVWHEKICPKYAVIEEGLKEFFPEHDTAWILFRLRWFPEEAYGWMPYEKHAKFKNWLRRIINN